MVSEKDQPKYREAYPRLDILKASAAHRRGEDICVFRDDRRRLLGAVRFIPVDAWAGAVLQGELVGPYLRFWQGATRIELRLATNGLDNLRRVAACPACKRGVQVLVYRHGWTCPKCQRLLYRRQLVDGETLAAEDLVGAQLRLKETRPRGMHQRTFAMRRAADLEMVDRLSDVVRNGWLRVASAAHESRVRGTWLSSEDIAVDSELSFRFGSTFDPAPAHAAVRAEGRHAQALESDLGDLPDREDPDEIEDADI